MNLRPFAILIGLTISGAALAAASWSATDPTPVPVAITYGHEVDIPMPAAFHVFAPRLVDWDRDGLVDVLATPATANAIYFLRNIGTPKSPRFDFPFGRPPLVGAYRERWTLFDAIEEEQARAADGGGAQGDLASRIGRTFDAADMDGDGDVDLLVSRSGKLAWLRNTGTATAPAWRPVDVVDEAGRPVTFTDFWHTVNPEAVDWDGDGRLDLLCGVWHPSGYVPGDIRILHPREAYGLRSAHIYFLRNVGTAEAPRYAGPVALAADTGVLSGLGIPLSRSVDWDGDGDLDLLVAYYDASIRYYENTGTRTQPRLIDRGLLEADGEPIAHAEAFRPDPSVADLDGDGDLDLVTGGHGRAVLWFENVGTRTAPRLTWRGGLPTRAVATTPLHLGNIITPVTHDVDGDGDRDLLAGNEPGIFLWAENAGTDVRPVFGPAQPLLGTDDRPIELFAKDLGMSMWGPLEDWDERTSPVPVDWDGDGLWDIVTSTMSGRVYWLRNAGSRTGPRFERPGAVQAAAGPLVSLPRSRPGIADWNGDGVPDVILPDARGLLTIYLGERRRQGEPIRLTKTLIPRSPADDGIVMHTSLGDASAGRAQHDVADWDGDGRLDIVVSKRSDRAPRRFRVMWYRNTATPDAPVLEGRELIPDVRSGHEAGLHVVDWNLDGVLDVLTGDQEGRVWFWDGRALKRD
ncbi:MAG TPA: VCBS repeat-containing protein [Vicinamibacterales bacterium]